MIERVAGTVLIGHLLEEDAKLARHLLGGRHVTAQGDEGRVERMHVGRQHLGRVPLGIQRDEHHVQPLAVRAQRILDFLGLQQRGGADVRALREAEEQQHHMVLEAGQRHGLAGADIGQRQLVAVVGAAQIGGLERHALLFRAASQPPQQGAAPQPQGCGRYGRQHTPPRQVRRAKGLIDG